MTSHFKQIENVTSKGSQQVSTPAAPLRVLLIDNNPERAQLVEEGLAEAAIVQTKSQVHGTELLNLIAANQPDVIIVDCNSPGRDSIESLRTVAQNNPKPIVMFVEEENPTGFQQAIEAGVSAYVVDGLTPKRVKPVIDVAIARFKVMNDLRSELKKTKDDLAARKVIEKAKGILMDKRGMTEEEAFIAMRTMSQERGIPLRDIAETVISVMSLLNE
ncbi:ANTAR domain-containing response regulator [Hirschia maritima]|uniref:ANTAR domain-containing response regulator n=1 Tax=Hirschia maritima TaxID=1121961 RepID=UPI0003A6FCAF|nr:ANTAR domain-containing protein [Hirschia maritima]